MNKTRPTLSLCLTILIAAFVNSATAQTLKWSYTLDIPPNHGYSSATALGQGNESLNRSAVECLNDGFGGTLWVAHLEGPTALLDRVVWLSSTGVPQFTNDFTVPYFNNNPLVTLVRLTKTDAVIQFTVGSGDSGRTNVLVRLKKKGSAVTQVNTALVIGETVGPVAAQNGMADKLGFFTRRLNDTNVVIRRFGN